MTAYPGDADAVALAATRSGLPFDVGCAHTLPDHDGVGRCQLWVGHQGEHAVMFVRDGARLVRFWDNDRPPLIHDGADCRCQPWVHGFPRPAWHEWAAGCAVADPDRASSDPTPRPPSLASRTVADAMLRQPITNPVTSTVADLRRLFADDHLHAALIVADGILITVVDRAEVQLSLTGNTPAASLGTRAGRTVGPMASLEQARRQLLTAGRRRLAVVDEQQRLLGLLCLKRGQDGFCSDRDVQARLAERSRTPTVAC
jgi:CBS domain-containing protein